MLIDLHAHLLMAERGAGHLELSTPAHAFVDRAGNFGTACTGTGNIVDDGVDATLFSWYLICGGALDAFPKPQSCITHAGGIAMFQPGRLSALNMGLAPDARHQRPLAQLAQFSH